jgi:carbamoyl-phosphate synthase large subunit
MKRREVRVMVMGAGGTAGINFIECLRMSGTPYHIVACDINKWHLELTDADARYLVPYSIEPDYIEALNRVIRAESVDLIHAQPDMEVEVLAENRDQLEARSFLPATPTIKACRDKMSTNEVLREKEVPVPLSFRIPNVNSIKATIDEIKERSGQSKVWLRALKGAGSKAALPVKTFRQAKEWIHYWRSTKLLETGDFMLSEFLPGREYAFQSLWVDGSLVVSQARMRLEYLMGNLFPSGQSSSPSVAVTVHSRDVNSVAADAVRAIDPQATGVFCVDIKENREGVPCITEINAGRFFTTSNFFAALGCNMPDHYVRIAMGMKPPSSPPYDALPEGHYWLRSVDRPPVAVREGAWTSIEARTLS